MSVGSFNGVSASEGERVIQGNFFLGRKEVSE